MKKLLTIVSLCLVVMMVLPLMTSAAFAYDHDPETGTLVADDKILIGLDCSNPAPPRNLPNGSAFRSLSLWRKC